IKSFIELNKYKDKSRTVLSKIHDYLKNDLIKLEKIKSEHADIKDTHKKIKTKILSFSSRSSAQPVNEYRGWDSQVCPKCKSFVEMLIEVCPQCHHNLGKMLQN
ncbi:hypothetical protein KKA14_03090, partial [bacterium]|nr:hypothetical protein [bacterium]